jgi:hypothetical protein
MRLALDAHVIDLMGLKERAGSQSTVNSALEQATSQIENYIGTSLERSTRVDYFGLNLRNLGSTAQPSYVLNLSAGYIDTTANFAVYVSSDGLPIESIGAANATLVDGISYAIEAKKGRVHLRTTLPSGYCDRLIAITYTCGFEVDDDGNAKDVPRELRESAISVAARIARGHSGTPLKSNSLREFQAEMRRAATSILSNCIKPRMAGNDPDMTEYL